MADLLRAEAAPLADREDAALMLALIGTEEPLRQLLADGKTPVSLRRRAAECLGLLAQRSTDSDQRHRIKEELERWLRNEPLEVRIQVEPDSAAVASLTQQVDAYVSQLQAAGGLAGLSEEQIQQGRKELLEQKMHKLPVNSELAPGWSVHDAHLPLLQGAALGMQLAASADLPLLGSGPGLVVPMLTLMTTEEENGLQIRTEVVEVPVWKLPLPPSEPLARGEHLELVMVPPATVTIGSPAGEDGRDVYRQARLKCDEDEKVDVEARRQVRLSTFAMVRHPISQGQWRAVVEGVASQERDLEAEPGKANTESLWDQHGQPGELAVDSVSWNDGQEWLLRLNFWLVEHWRELGGNGEAPQLALPSESQWEAACRGCEPDEESTPFHFGVTLDASWERYDASSTFGLGRRGAKVKQPGVNGAHGLVNRLGLAELHGQVLEWCGDQWHRDPAAGAPVDGSAIEGPDPDLRGTSEEFFRLLRGGSWFNDPRYCRAACRSPNRPDVESTCVGLRPCCPSPPGSILGA
jgi:formylglycine-generating enzyme required for sulfatase activity